MGEAGRHRLGRMLRGNHVSAPRADNVELVIHVDDLKIHGRGKVRTSHPTIGNGIAFTQMLAEDWLRLHQLIARVAAAAPRPGIAAANAAAQADTTPHLEALLQLLERKGVLTRDEFLAEVAAIKPRVGG